MNSSASDLDWDERTSAPRRLVNHTDDVFDSLFERSADAIWLYDPETSLLVDCNRAAVELIGAKNKRQLLGTRPEELSPPLQPDGMRSADKSAQIIAIVDKQKAYRFEWVIRRLDGREVPVEVSSTALIKGRKSIHVVISRDISERKKAERELLELTQVMHNSERKRAERALRDSEAKFRALFEGSSQGVVLHDENQLLEINPAAVRIMGCHSPTELIGKHPKEMAPPLQPNGESSEVMAQKFIEETMSKGSARFEWLASSPAGEDIPLEVALTRIEWSDRQIIQAFITDISERKRTEEELLKTLEREKELSRLKSNFVSMVSHEFRTPLGIIQSSAELLRDFHDKMRPYERTEQLESITRNTQRMAGMMEEILVLSRLDAGKLEFRPSPMDFETFCHRIVEEVLFSTQHRCPIELSVAPTLPRAQADERLLGHIFNNLLSNAVKYSDAGTSVQFKVGREAGNAFCIIRDKGIGISEEDQNNLFTAFHRGTNVGSRSGTGLGLVLVKRCVELHRAQVRIQSALGQGTTVTLRLPIFETNRRCEP